MQKIWKANTLLNTKWKERPLNKSITFWKCSSIQEHHKVNSCKLIREKSAVIIDNSPIWEAYKSRLILPEIKISSTFKKEHNETWRNFSLNNKISALSKSYLHKMSFSPTNLWYCNQRQRQREIKPKDKGNQIKLVNNTTNINYSTWHSTQSNWNVITANTPSKLWGRTKTNIRNDGNSHFIIRTKSNQGSIQVTETKNKDSTNINSAYFSTWSGLLKNGAQKKENQDSSLIIHNILGWTKMNWYSVMDGHGDNGHFASKFVADKQQEYFTDMNNYIDKTKANDPLHNKIKLNEDSIIWREMKNKNKIVTSFFKMIGKAIQEQEWFNAEFSGTTCVTVLHIKNKWICANVGDSRCWWVKSNPIHPKKFMFEQWSIDHKPNREEEMSRIIRCGGSVQKDSGINDDKNEQIDKETFRVYLNGKAYPGLAISRSIGDSVAEKIGVISTPDIFEKDIKFEDKYIILASDGVWDYMNGNDIIETVTPFYYNDNPQGAVDAIVNRAKQIWKDKGLERDDITAIVVFLNWIQPKKFW